jgi:UDP-N-acetylglucosamine/UDP-N-acetylgalactosamine diphosphorylase
MSYEQVRQRYADAGQEHVFAFYDTLNESQKAAYVSQLASIDPQRAVDIYKQAVAADDEGVSGKIEPPPRNATHTLIKDDPMQEEEWRQLGLQAIHDGKVAVLLMAGGQGTRLGSSAPKGCFDIGLPSHKSLFQIQAERIEAVGKLAGASIPWYVMTSGPTRQPTEDFFLEHAYFGLERKDIIFFEQGVSSSLR